MTDDADEARDLDENLAVVEAEAFVVERRLEREAGRLRMAGLFLLVAICFTAIWLYPQRWGAYDILGLIFVMALITASCIFTYGVAQLLVDEPMSEVFHALLGQPLSIRSRGRFLNRLDHACDDGRLRSRIRTFSLVVIRRAACAPSGDDRMRLLYSLIRTVVRGRDVVGELADDDIGIIALGAGPEAARALCARVQAKVRTELKEEVRIAWANFDADGIQGEDLIAVATERLGEEAAPNQKAA